MPETATRPRVALFSDTWGRAHDERGFVARGIAGAVSRTAAVDVFVPGAPGPARPDGGFDLTAVGAPATDDGWPAPDEAELSHPGPYALAIVDRASPGACRLVRRHLPGVPITTIVSGHEHPPPQLDGAPCAGTMAVGLPPGPAGTDPATGANAVGHYVGINALASQRRHVGIGFTGYVLVLGGDDHQPGSDLAGGDPDPSALTAWLLSRFTRDVIVVVDDAIATVWRSRSLLGRMTVDSRMDLWRLVSHAAVTVDQAPGALVARECVESLRYGVPVVVPAGTPAAHLAASGGGLWYQDVPELLGCVEALQDPALRTTLGAQGREIADRWYGDAAAFVARVGAAVAALGRDGRSR
jgi:hypothetical protein